MINGSGRVLQDSGAWYLITPAQVQPQMVVDLDWLGPPAALLQKWVEQTSETVQDAQLLQLWDSVCDWCVTIAVDEVVVEGAVDFDAVPLKPLGFVKQSSFSWRSMPFPIVDTWRFTGTPAAVASVLRSLRAGPGYTLAASSRRVERLWLRGDSWDAAYVNVAGLPDSQSLSAIQRIVAVARSRTE